MAKDDSVLIQVRSRIWIKTVISVSIPRRGTCGEVAGEGTMGIAVSRRKKHTFYMDFLSKERLLKRNNFEISFLACIVLCTHGL